jgi:hypothetical protein
MKHLIGTLVASLTFIAGLFVTGWLHPSGFRDCVVAFYEYSAVAENDIALAVFRQQLEQFRPETEAPTYYLSYSNNNDPDEAILNTLNDQGFSVRPISQLRMGFRSSPELGSEIILRVGTIRWVDANTVVVGGSCRRWYQNSDTAYLYYIVRQGSGWVVRTHELL